MDPISGFFEGALQPVVRLALFAICILAGCWLGLYLGQVDNFAHLPPAQALGRGLVTMFAQYPSIQTIGATLPDMLIKGLMSIWKFPFVLCVPVLIFRIVIAETGILPLGGLTLALEAVQTYTVVGGGTGFSITILVATGLAAIAWHCWCWWRETNWVEALDGPKYVPKEDPKKKKKTEAEDDMFMPPVAAPGSATGTAHAAYTEQPYPYATETEPGTLSGEAEAAAAATSETTANSFASLYAEDTTAGDGATAAAGEDIIPGETEEERYHRQRQAREAQEREERESRLRVQQHQKKPGPGGRGRGH